MAHISQLKVGLVFPEYKLPPINGPDLPAKGRSRVSWVQATQSMAQISQLKVDLVFPEYKLPNQWPTSPS